MGESFKETILKLLSNTNYSLDNLSPDDISKFENLPQLKPLFEWMTHNLSKDNCVTPEELQEFKELEEQGKVKYGEELEEALQKYLGKDGKASVSFGESLDYVEQELALLKEQLEIKQLLLDNQRASNTVVTEEISEIKKDILRAEAEQTDKIKEILAANKKLKDEMAEAQAKLNELREDIIRLAQNAPEDTFTSDNLDLKKSISVYSNTSSSSWKTIHSTVPDSDKNYMCQLSLKGYQKVHKQLHKRLTKLIDGLSKVSKLQSGDKEHKELYAIKERLEQQMCHLINNEAEIEGLRAARVKVKELKNAMENGECLLSRIEDEEDKLDSEDKDDSLIIGKTDDLADVCRQWSDLQALRAVELKQQERINISKQICKKLDEVLSPLILKLNADTILTEVFQHEKEKIEYSINLYKTFHVALQNQYDSMKKRIETMEKNEQDFEKFCSIPLEHRHELLEQLAPIVMSDNEGVVQAVQNLEESSKREHETMFGHYVHEKNKLVASAKHLADSSRLVICQSSSNDTASSEVVVSVQQGLDQLNCGIEEVNNGIHHVL